MCFVQACELMDALKKNLRQEHVLIHEFLSTFYTQVAVLSKSFHACSEPQPASFCISDALGG